ncbi:hypothetical protein D0860_00089 [Hortaea werneckii]|uniref:Heterokaryon incompatibility domain-containing protein n=1 Tax=Hortaea werneckii TaxID=91943 RepID=A0A3M7HY57_HORWE|nr:hypothetical protein D0860_00089 [Hortaea werneckii]RMZ32666.1 hypothetical protein D0859_03182 [Hortaea werneckii]
MSPADLVDRHAPLQDEQDTPLDRSNGLSSGSLKYPYRPLDKESLEIRLLTIYPTTDPSEVPVKCSLSHANLGKEPKPNYETISYAWGTSKERKTIVVDDFSLEVPVSAERAIRRMRLRDQSRVLWIDAVCVNQADTNEKNHQVGIMAEIYSNTLQGLIWLGEADDSTEKALESIETAYADSCAETNSSGDLYTKVVYGGSPGILQPVGFTPDFAALIQFFKLPWFRRRWVIQEALLAPSSQCIIGNLELSWATIVRGTVWIIHKARMLPGSNCFLEAATRVLKIWLMAEKKQAGGHISLNTIMLSSLGSEVGDERDTVYALLGLWLKLQHQTKLHPLLAPDYHKSPDAVVCDATRYSAAVDSDLIHFRSLDHRCNPDPLEKKLPSWAASWYRVHDLTCDTINFSLVFNAHGRNWRRHFRPPSEDSSRILSVRGKMVEHVRAVTEVIDPHKTPDHVVAIIEQLKTALSSFHHQDSALNISSRLGKVLIAGFDHLHKPATDDLSVQGYADWFKYLRRENYWPPHWSMVDESGAATLRNASRYDSAFWDVCRNRVLFATETGRLGVGPQTMKENDLASILYGCPYPVILRRCPNCDLHEFIGVAYVEGIMFGQAVEDPEAKEDVTFHLQ